MSSTYNLTFVKQVPGRDYTVPGLNITIPDGKLYIVYDNEEEAGRFYTHLNISYAIFGEVQVLIRRQKPKGLFGREKYLVSDPATGREIAKLYYSLPFDSTSATIEIPGTPKYYWHHLAYETVSLVKPQTWLNYKARMSNGRNEIIFSGRFGEDSRLFRISRNDKPLSGTITVKDKTQLLALICGLYIVEYDLDAGYSES